MLLNHSNVKKIHEKPIVLRWFVDPKIKTATEDSDLSDPSDLCDQDKTFNKKQMIEEKNNKSDDDLMNLFFLHRLV